MTVVLPKATCPKCGQQADVVRGTSVLVVHKVKGKVCSGSASAVSPSEVRAPAAAPDKPRLDAIEREPPLMRRDTQGGGLIEMTRDETVDELKTRMRTRLIRLKGKSEVLEAEMSRLRYQHKVTDEDMRQLRKTVGDDVVDLMVAVMLRAPDPDHEIRRFLREHREMG